MERRDAADAAHELELQEAAAKAKALKEGRDAPTSAAGVGATPSSGGRSVFDFEGSGKGDPNFWQTVRSREKGVRTYYYCEVRHRGTEALVILIETRQFTNGN